MAAGRICIVGRESIITRSHASSQIVTLKEKTKQEQYDVVGYLHREVVEKTFPSCGAFKEVVNAALKGGLDSLPLLHEITTLPQSASIDHGGHQAACNTHTHTHQSGRYIQFASVKITQHQLSCLRTHFPITTATDITTGSIQVLNNTYYLFEHLQHKKKKKTTHL